MKCHYRSAVDNGYDGPVGCWCSACIYGNVRHLDTFRVTSLFIYKRRYKNLIFSYHQMISCLGSGAKPMLEKHGMIDQ